MGLLSWLTGRKKKEEVKIFKTPDTSEHPVAWGGSTAGHGGHRGIAVGSREEPDYSPENIAKRKAIGADEAHEFIHEEAPLFVHSTWIALLQYHHADEKLMVEFLDGCAILVDEVSEEEAWGWLQAPSKGVHFHQTVLGENYVPKSGLSLKSWTVIKAGAHRPTHGGMKLNKKGEFYAPGSRVKRTTHGGLRMGADGNFYPA